MGGLCSMVDLRFVSADGKRLFIEQCRALIGLIDYYRIIKRKIT